MNTLHTAPQAARTVRLVSAAAAALITLVLFNGVASLGAPHVALQIAAAPTTTIVR